jgi:hypothetical protein
MMGDLLYPFPSLANDLRRAVFFFAKKDLIALNKSHTDKPRKQENYKNAPPSSGIVVLVEQAATPAKPAASPPNSWTGRIPFATRKSTFLGA